MRLKLQTKRLILRDLKLSDAKDASKNANNLNVSKWMASIPYPYTIKDATKWINSISKESKKRPRKNYNLGIELKEEKRIIGGIGLNLKPEHKKGSFGYWLGENYWRKGYGSEALEALIDFSFNQLKLRRLEAEVYVGNPSSGKLLEKFGFKQEGLRRKGHICKADGKFKDAILYGLLKEEYKKK